VVGLGPREWAIPQNKGALDEVVLKFPSALHVLNCFIPLRTRLSFGRGREGGEGGGRRRPGGGGSLGGGNLRISRW